MGEFLRLGKEEAGLAPVSALSDQRPDAVSWLDCPRERVWRGPGRALDVELGHFEVEAVRSWTQFSVGSIRRH